MTGLTTTKDSRHASDRPSIEDRGTLRVHPAVVRKLAERTAGRMAGTISDRAHAGVRTGQHGPTATVRDRGDAVDITLQVALRYPARVAVLSERLRNRVTEQVYRITGRRVGRVAITVSALLPESRHTVE